VNLNLLRYASFDRCTFGRLSIDAQFECYTLERPEVQIPAGTYSVEVTFSPRFQRFLPLLDSVPGRTDIRIHMGNCPKDTEGCILVGQQISQDSQMILSSLASLTPLVQKIQLALDASEPVVLSIS
jgi:hypothetical protein